MGATAVAREFYGVRISGLQIGDEDGGDGMGLQVGAVIIARDVSGIQIAVWGDARDVKGVQIGR